MTSYHSVFWTPTQIGYTQVRSDRGRLYFLPRHLPLEHPPRGGLFAERVPRPHRIHIARVREELTLRQDASKPKTRSTISIIFEKTFDKTFGKLAHPRGNARRILRSWIIPGPPNPHPDDPLPSTQTQDDTQPPRRSWRGKRRSTLIEAESMRTSNRSSMVDPVSGAMTTTPSTISRPELRETTPSWRAATQAMSAPGSARIPEDKPIASGNGVSVGISLAEPVLFLQGFEPVENSERSTTMLRGSLHLKVTKPSKLKTVSLKFRGTATTKWPEGIPPKKQDTVETDSIMNHTWPFFNAQFPAAKFGPCADHVELTRVEPPTEDAWTLPANRASFSTPFKRSPMTSSTNVNRIGRNEAKRLSLQVNQSRSFNTGESPSGGPTVRQKGYRTFLPGDYIYNFELPLDSHVPETIDVELGTVKYELEASVERAGAFKPKIAGTKEVVLIRTPSEGSLEQVEPIAISRNWEDQLHYDIVISGKSFPLGAKVPIAFKLTPLAKVQCHRIKVFVTENVEYYCNSKRVHRMGGTRKVQLFEKRADAPPTSTFEGSSMRILSGGGLDYDQRQAAARGEEVQPTDCTNLLGDLDSGSLNIGPTEMEFNVQLPSCTQLKDKESQREREQKLHFDTTYQNIQVHHWIKIVMRLSKPDADNPAKRRHFEISIDSPFHLLSCRATQANTALPAYSCPQQPGVGDGANSRLYECGCPGAAPKVANPTSYLPTLNNLSTNREDDDSVRATAARTDSNESVRGLARPAAAHVQGPDPGPGFQQLPDERGQRPIHLLRAPSFSPPAFEDEAPPPPLETPPPMYETIASPTSGLADYFARLSDAYEGESEGSDSDGVGEGRSRTSGATPGGRMVRSMDEQRSWVAVGEEMGSLSTMAGGLSVADGRWVG